jgi:hypothetical protein
LDDLLDEVSDRFLDDIVGWLVDDLPLVRLRIDDCEHSEDRHDFLRVPMDMLLEVNETVLDRILKRLLQLLVQFFQVVKPLRFDLLLASKEQGFVNGKQLSPDDFEVLLEQILFFREFAFLLVHKLLEFVELSFLDLGEDGAGDYLELVRHSGAPDLKVIDFLVIFKTVVAALVHKRVRLGQPVEPSDARLNELVQRGQMVVEELLLSWGHQLDYVVVVSHHKHYVLSQHSELLASDQ